MKKLVIILFAMVSALCISPMISYAGGPGFDDNVKNWDDDDDGHDDDHCDDDDDDSNEIPLDGGLSVLAVAGAAYGVKRIRDSRNKK